MIHCIQPSLIDTLHEPEVVTRIFRETTHEGAERYVVRLSRPDSPLKRSTHGFTGTELFSVARVAHRTSKRMASLPELQGSLAQRRPYTVLAGATRLTTAAGVRYEVDFFREFANGEQCPNFAWADLYSLAATAGHVYGRILAEYRSDMDASRAGWDWT